jgi:replication-associated recombination protein RarA
MTDQSSLFGSDTTLPVQKDTPLPTSEEPLAARMRPRTLDEIVGQEHLLGPDKVLRRNIEADTITSMIF